MKSQILNFGHRKRKFALFSGTNIYTIFTATTILNTQTLSRPLCCWRGMGCTVILQPSYSYPSRLCGAVLL